MEKSKKKQHATLTLIDDGKGSFSAQVTYQPSVKDRREDSPCVNAMIKLSVIIARGRDMLAAPLQLQPNVTKKELTKPTKWQRVKDFFK
jgi:hypothetical protein